MYHWNWPRLWYPRIGGINETKIDLYRININSKVIKCKRIERIGKLDENIMHDKGVIGSNPQSIHLLVDPLHSARRKRFINFEIALNFIHRISLNYLVWWFSVYKNKDTSRGEQYRKCFNRAHSAHISAHQIAKYVSSKKRCASWRKICFWNHLTNSSLV